MPTYRLKITREKAEGLLRAQIERGNRILEMEVVDSSSARLASREQCKWENYLHDLILTIFEDPRGVLQQLEDVWDGRPASPDDIPRRVRFLIHGLESLLERLGLFEEPQTCSTGVTENHENGLRRLERILSRFEVVARQLSRRWANRETLAVRDEHDVQDLLHALLKIDFDDVRPEEWTPSYAGGAARMDFLLKAEELIVEAKMTREGLADKEVGEQLLIDIARYRGYPKVRHLVCFVYDPDRRLRNSNGLKHDLELHQTEGLAVTVQIFPRM